MPSKADYDTLDCPRCDKPTKPAKINAGGSVRYRCDCGDGVVYGWTINLSGEMVNETQHLSSTDAGATNVPKMKIYSINDGRINYAVAATSRTKAVELFNSAGLATSIYDQSEYGEVWPAGERDDYAIVEMTPSVVFEAPILMRDIDRWEISRFQAPASTTASNNSNQRPEAK